MTTDNDFVAEKLGLWKRGQSEEMPWDLPSRLIPAPDLLANPWLLVEALWKRGWWFGINRESVTILSNEGVTAVVQIDGNLPAALLRATAEMLRKEE